MSNAPAKTERVLFTQIQRAMPHVQPAPVTHSHPVGCGDRTGRSVTSPWPKGQSLPLGGKCPPRPYLSAPSDLYTAIDVISLIRGPS
jgi:hypothetical protein